MDFDVLDDPNVVMPSSVAYTLEEIYDIEVLGLYIEYFFNNCKRSMLKSDAARNSRLIVNLEGDGEYIYQATVYVENAPNICRF